MLRGRLLLFVGNVVGLARWRRSRGSRRFDGRRCRNTSLSPGERRTRENKSVG